MNNTLSEPDQIVASPSHYKKSVKLEEERLQNVTGLKDYGMIHERHRIFPEIFEKRNHKKILDIAAGVGVVADRINRLYDGIIIGNDISPKCIASLQSLGIQTLSFDIDDSKHPFPISDAGFDAIIALATIEHLYNTDHFIYEIRRCLTDDGYLYLSAPNYNALGYLIPMLKTGKTFHDPLNSKERYEFFAHLRYFTYRTLLEYVSSFGFQPECVYLGLPEGSTKFLKLKETSAIKASVFRLSMKALYRITSPRWASEPVICFKKTKYRSIKKGKIRKVIL